MFVTKKLTNLGTITTITFESLSEVELIRLASERDEDVPNDNNTYVREVFDLFDFWDGRDGLIDAFKVGDLLRCLDLNPTLDLIFKNGGTKKMGEKQYAFEDFMPIVESVLKTKDMGTFAEFKEAFKSFDREGQGYISGGELRYMLTALGEKINDEECEEILKLTDTHEDMEGNIKYEDFIKKVMAGPPEAKK